MGGDILNPNQMAQHLQIGGDTSNPKTLTWMTQQKLPTSQGGDTSNPHILETDKPTDMKIDSESMDYMDENPPVLMLREEGTC